MVSMNNGMMAAVGLACALSGISGASGQTQSLDKRQHLNVQMMVESVLHGIRQECDDMKVSDAQLQLSGTYDKNGFQAGIVGQAGGMNLDAAYSGTLVQKPGGWFSSVLGEGNLGGDVWISEIEGIWEENIPGKVTALYYSEEATSPLDKPKWWVYAGEIIVGGLIGGGGTLGTGALAGAATAVNISNAIASQAAPTGYPPLPAAPSVISMDPEIGIDQIVVVVSGTGDISGNNGNIVRFVGQWSEGLVSGSIIVTAATTCYADCDSSGNLDFFDFLCYQNLFASGSAQADCDGSGNLDFFDFLCFQNSFAAGCP